MTYKEIQRVYQCKFNKTIKTCWIADVKRQMGMKVRNAYNRQGATIINKCPANLIAQIKQVIGGQITCP